MRGDKKEKQAKSDHRLGKNNMTLPVLPKACEVCGRTQQHRLGVHLELNADLTQVSR